MQTQTTYIEPEGFKGTPGQFYRNNTYVLVADKCTEVAYCATKSMEARYEPGDKYVAILREMRNNAQLFAASKDLLREAQDLMARVKRAYSILHKDPVTSNWGMLDTTGMERAINKALGNPSNTTKLK